MSNASRCRAAAALYARRAELAGSAEERRACRALERLWLEMAPHAERFDRRIDEGSKEQIYAMIDAVAAERRQMA